MKPLSIYVHIPFCASKCAYCDFLSFPGTQDDYGRYIDALLSEIETKAAELRDYEVKTVFIGGGTPTLLAPEQLCRIIRTIEKNYKCGRLMEITVEANPKTVSYESLLALRSSGVNRLSFGLQSNNNRLLRLMGRIHDCQTFEKNYSDAGRAGFTNINVDIMFALPSQPLDEWESTLRYVIAKNPAHISAYGLSLEEGTPLYDAVSKGELALPDEDTYLEMYRSAKRALKNAGYERYEISNYAKPGFICRHNMTYWRCGEYVGYGLGASSYIGSVRFRNVRALGRYLDREFVRQEEQIIAGNETVSEFMFLGLRTVGGVSESEFEHRFGAPVNVFYSQKADSLINAGVLARENGRLLLTERGTEVSNRVFAEFLL